MLSIYLLRFLTFFLCLFLHEYSFAKSQSTSYNRKAWKHWIDEDQNCLNTRQEVLKEQSIVLVTQVKCKVTKGKWNDFYFNEVLEDPLKIDIDHVVPLKHAHDNGGAGWSQDQKKLFANDKLNLVVTSRKANRTKGSNDFTSWSPINKGYACKYMKRWFEVKEKYKLNISQSEIEQKQIMDCP